MEIASLCKRLRALPHDYDHIDHAFLEIASPSIPDGLHAALQKGATRITVLPYFLAAGKHVVNDIPAEIKQVQDKHPRVQIIMAPYLGLADSIPELLLQQAAAAKQA